jgi:hypothetical protein
MLFVNNRLDKKEYFLLKLISSFYIKPRKINRKELVMSDEWEKIVEFERHQKGEIYKKKPKNNDSGGAIVIILGILFLIWLFSGGHC